MTNNGATIQACANEIDFTEEDLMNPERQYGGTNYDGMGPIVCGLGENWSCKILN